MTTPIDDLELPDEDYAPPKLAFAWADLPRETLAPGGYRALNAFCDSRIELGSGRVIRLETLHQFKTYGGVLLGLPWGDASHDYHVEEALSEAKRHFDVEGQEVHILPPAILVSTVKTTRGGEGLKEEAVEFLPPICTVARFSSSAIDDNEGMESVLVVAWFQKTYGPPSDPSVIEEITKIDWEARAVDCSW